ncbi:MAG: hypothetical protein JOS17DRAFT_778020 [Linnemannia elongata]|nr:MAG: hypothetical protein JOS17DRAFT_778020 [Linnemannia elongata]
MTSIHPLEIPEIITRIGNFLPLWSQERAEGTGRLKLVFDPKTFHTCLLVSTIWHDTLIPILWSYYEAEAMEFVPRSTLVRYSILFRTFRQHHGYGTRALDSYGCSRVVKATLNPETIEELEESRRMVKENDGRLKELEWNGPTESAPLRVEDFAGLRTLERLNMSRWKVDGGRLWRVLEVLAGSLRILEIDWLSVVDKLSGIDDDGGDVEGVTVILPMLEVYRACGPPYGPDPANFVKQCPNLVRSVLSLDAGKGYYRDDNKDITRLADSLRTHCPSLRALTVKGSIPPEQKAILIRNCTSIPSRSTLLELVVDVQSMGKDIMDSISAHAQTLETLGILTSSSIDDEATIMMKHILQISVQCPRLKWFAVHAIYSYESAKSILGGLKAAAWQSSAMEILDLNAGDPSETWGDGVFKLKDLFANGPILGWYYHPKKKSLSWSDDDVYWSEAFARELFESIRGLDNLRVLRWCGTDFTRSSYYDRTRDTPLLY